MIVDPLPIVREGLTSVLNRSSAARLKVVGEADSVLRATEAIERHKPHVCVLGMDFEVTPGNESIRSLVQKNRNTSFVLFPSQASELDCEAAIRYGAKGIYSRLHDLSLLPKCIREVHDGKLWFERAVTGRLLNSLLVKSSFEADAPGWDRLTVRERTIVQLVIAGEINKQIAAQLNMSNSTVAHSLTSIYRKLNVPDRTNLMLFARKHGLS